MSRSLDERRGLGLILLSAAAYGTMPVLAKVAYARGVTVSSLLAWRFLVACVLFAWLAPPCP